ncbi:purine/pyrimidine permease [Bacillus marinisedimentorum]|uniref:purine/pyrimidine permease n=1 Tax=Bacillus marinisedimentorum TaxID=1821260 RepID=UPI000871B620|nr:purine/pyrimidine permease [Bacillus marinisedimentorum]
MRTTLGSLQWFVFILAGSIVAPLSIGSAFGLPLPEIAAFMQRTLFVLGIAGILQAALGHRLPIMEGPAGLWWGIFLIYAGFAAAGGLDPYDALRQLEGALFISGFLFAFLAVFKLVKYIRVLFTPLVTGTYLILLGAQLSGSFIKGMLGIGYVTEGIHVRVAVLSFVVVIISILLSKSSNRLLSSYSVLITLIIGWILFAAFDLTVAVKPAEGWMSVPEVFVWGMPSFQAGMGVTAILVGLLLLTNMIATVQAVESVLEKQGHRTETVNMEKASFVMAVNQWLSGIFSAVGPVPISGTAGFIKETKVAQRLPFMIGSGLLAAISLFPAVTSFFAALPAPVGYATVFVPIASLIGIGLKSYVEADPSETEYFIIAVSIMIGFGGMFVPADAVHSLPSFLQTVVNNGLILGLIVCILMEQIVRFMRWKRAG